MTRRRGVLIGLALAVLLIALPFGAAKLVLASIDPAVVKARILAEVQRATGRQLTIGGAIQLGLLPDLTIDADNVALANPAGFSRPAMITAHHLHARLALLPLLSHRVIIRALDLAGADLKLEQADGAPPNWVFIPTHAPATPPQTPPATAPQPQEKLRLDRLTILGISVTDGTVSWQTPHQAGSVGLPHASLQEINASSTIYLTAATVLAGEPATVTGRFGGQTHLWNSADRSDWPVVLKLTSDIGTIDIAGTLTAPRSLAGYDITLRASGSDLGQLALPWPQLQIPRLHNVALDTRLIDRPDGLDIPRLNLTAEASDIGASIEGLSLTHLQITAPNIDGTNGTQPNHVSVGGQYAGQALELDGTLGPIGRLFGRGQIAARSPITLDATATAAGATLEVHGRVAPFGDWAGTDASVKASIPDLAALSPLVRRPLPRLHDIAFAAAVRSAGGVLTLQDASVTLPEADIRASGSARLAGRPRYDGTLTIAHLDLDSLRAALPAPASPSGAAPPGASQAPGAAPAPSPWVISDRKLPIARLRDMDADISISLGHLLLHGVAIDDLSTHLLLAQDRLTLDPVTGKLAGIPVSASLSVDAGPTPAAIALTVHAPGLDLGRVLAVTGGSQTASGALDLDADLTGSGETPHDIAGTLDGHLGLAITHGTIDNHVLTAGLTYLLPLSRIGLSLPAVGTSTIGCLATRLDLRQGVAVPRAFLLDLGKFHLAAAGAIDLRTETLALRLRPYLSLGITGLVLPSHADGSWRDPRLTLEAANGALSTAATVAALLTGRDTSLSATLSGLAGSTEPALAAADSGDCTAALAAARDTSDTLPPIVAAPPPRTTAKTERQKAVELLRRLFK